MEFSDIALAKFLQTSPELAPYIVNFMELTEELDSESGSIRVGVFVLNAGQEVVLVPIISKGDSVFPIDSMFFESEGLFKPVCKATTNYLLGLANSSSGSAKKIPDSVNTNPNLSKFIDPPRTGKFLYASASRLTEFLAILPKPIKQFTIEKIASEKSLYDKMDRLFGLKSIFEVLNGADSGNSGVNDVPTGPDPIRVQTLSVITTPNEIALLGDENLSKTYLDQGFAVTGSRDTNRIAVAHQPYNEVGTFTNINPLTDGGKDYKVALRGGECAEIFIPKYHRVNPYTNANQLIGVFSDGSYASGPMVTYGDKLDTSKIINDLFEASPPKLLRDLFNGDKFLIFTNKGEALGPFTANSVLKTLSGVEVRVTGPIITSILGSQNFTNEASLVDKTLIVPSNVLVIVLGEDRTSELQRSVMEAAKLKDFMISNMLGCELDLRYDGVEFSANGAYLGSVPTTMKYLVEKEEIDPSLAANFVKQAQQSKLVKIFLSKKASSEDFSPAPIPQYGNSAAPQPEVGLNGSTFVESLQQASSLNDSQVAEATVIAQLLQAPDLQPYVVEYLPELDQAVDRLGRILFISRINLSKLSESLDSDSVFSLISQIRNVYRQLGETTLKLKSISSVLQNTMSDLDTNSAKGG